MTDTTYAMSVKNGAAVNVCVFIIGDYPHTDLFVKIEQIDDMDFSIRDVCFSHTITLRTSFCMYGYDNYRRTLSVTIYLGESVDFMTKPSTDA